MITNIPLNYKQAISCNNKNHWIEAMNVEQQNLYDNKILIFKKKILKGVNPTTTKWVSTLKRVHIKVKIKY